MRRRQTILIGDILDEFFKRPYIAAQIAESKLPETWRAIVGDRVAKFTRELRLENHILYVKIESSLLRHELFHQREALKEEINRRSKVRIVNSVIVR
ncbi:MAG: DUF721 domain-containing protein [Rikenellaceae bacterium]